MGAAVMAVLFPLSRRSHVARASGTQSGTLGATFGFYQNQLGELTRDEAAGLIMPEEARSARDEIARRLINDQRQSGHEDDVFQMMSEPSLRRRRSASLVILFLVPVMAFATYHAYGSPDLPDMPFATRAQNDPRFEAMQSLAKIEAHLKKNPQDGRGWDVLAPVYLRIGRSKEAVEAYQKALSILGDSPSRLTAYGEALMAVNEGRIVEEAQKAFLKSFELDASNPKSRYYRARIFEQQGESAKAREAYQDLLNASQPDAPWVALLEERMKNLKP
jgi:cytochrome c-type biogenesis protein CcmH